MSKRIARIAGALLVTAGTPFVLGTLGVCFETHFHTLHRHRQVVRERQRKSGARTCKNRRQLRRRFEFVAETCEKQLQFGVAERKHITRSDVVISDTAKRWCRQAAQRCGHSARKVIRNRYLTGVK